MQKNNRTKQEILDAAEKLFSEKGYNATSVSDITKKVGITKPLFFYYFKTKGDIFVELMRIKRNEAIKGFIEKRKNGKIPQSKEAIYRACITFIKQNQNIFRIAMFEFLKTNIGTNIIMELPKEVFEKFDDIFEFSKEEQLRLIILVIKTTMFSAICDNLCESFDVSEKELEKIYDESILK